MNGTSSRLMIGVLFALVLGAIAAFGLAATTGQEQQVEESNALANYEIILQRNIFSRDRKPIVVGQPEEEPKERAVVSPESYYRLKGLVQEDGVFIAFVEDTRYSNVLRLREGESVARGTIKNLTLDSLEYEYNDKTVAIQIGRDLEGGFGAVTRSEIMQWTPTDTTSGSDSTSTSPEPATGEAADILEQLRQRRQQQLGR